MLRDGATLVWADYRGNGMFQTDGNLTVDPRAALLIPDFADGSALLLSGRASCEVRAMPYCGVCCLASRSYIV